MFETMLQAANQPVEREASPHGGRRPSTGGFHWREDNPDHQRTQRLALAALIALSSTSAVIASIWTLDRLKIDRMGGPNSPDFQLVQLSMLAPPPVVDPPPPPPDQSTEVAALAGPAARTETLEESPDTLDSPLQSSPAPSGEIPDPVTGQSGIPTIPGLSGGGPCPGGICVGPPGPGGGAGGGCTGPNCGVTGGHPAPAPTQVAFSALHCLACPDPDQAELRRTASRLRQRDGAVIAHFCVGTGGRVEADSVKITRSFGDQAVDRVARAAVLSWRFSPLKVAGEARRACSDARFNIRFD